jgi:hypothetical protein
LSEVIVDLRAYCAALAVALGGWGAALAGSGNEIGWSLSLDSRHRAFLSWRSQSRQDRDLLLGCLRDVDSFTARAEALGPLGDAKDARLVLTRGPHRFEVAGAVSRDQDSSQSVFDSDVDIEGTKRKTLSRQLLPVLKGSGDIGLTITLEPGSRPVVSRSIPTAGLAPLLDRFHAVCFR